MFAAIRIEAISESASLDDKIIGSASVGMQAEPPRSLTVRFGTFECRCRARIAEYQPDRAVCRITKSRRGLPWSSNTLRKPPLCKIIPASHRP